MDVFGQDKTYAEIQQVQSLDHFAQRHYKNQRRPSPEIESAFQDENLERNTHEPIDFCVISPSRNPSELLEEFCKTHRYKLKRTSHEFMFHRQFIALLIRLGYRDAKKKHDELATFFDVKDADFGKNNQKNQAIS